MHRSVSAIAGLCLLLSVAVAAAQTPASEPTNGETLFRQRCGACHQVATPRNGVGPHLQGVVGRAAGSVEGYNYSPAIKGSGIVWSTDNLDGFLTNPGAMVRGTRMTQRFANAAERQAIIEFLQQKQD